MWPRVKVDARKRRPNRPASRPTAGAGQVTLTWNDPSDPSIVEYQYQQGTKSGETITWSGAWQNLPAGAVATRTHTVTGLQAGMEYAFRIRAQDRYDKFDENRIRLR